MIETLLEASLSENYINTKEFMYEMAKRYRRVDQGRSSVTVCLLPLQSSAVVTCEIKKFAEVLQKL